MSVHARDVVWSIDRARDSTVNAQYALLLRQIASVTAEGDRRVVFRFRRAYPEQLYDATWHVQRVGEAVLRDRAGGAARSAGQPRAGEVGN